MEAENDLIIEKFHPHFFHFLGFYTVGILFFFAGILFNFWIASALGILIFLCGEIFRKADTFFILENGVARQYKLFATSRKSVLYRNIQNIEVHQTFFENILGIGHIKFDTSGSDNVEVHFYSVSNPYKIERAVRQKTAEAKLH